MFCLKKKKKNSTLNTSSALSNQTATTPPPPRPPPPEIPKSPPKWPLRPGVMVHVKVNTKQNLCATRIQNPTESIIEIMPTSPQIPATQSSQNISYASPVFSGDCGETILDKSTIKSINPPVLPLRNNNLTIVTIKDDIDDLSNRNDELINFTTSSLIERLLKRLRWRRGHETKQTNSSQNILSKSNKRAVNLLRNTGWFGSGKSTNSSTGLFDNSRHHLSGIKCTDGGKLLFFYYFFLYLNCSLAFK